MNYIERQRSETEKLIIKNCPCCNGNILARDCGYSSFNTGSANCEICKREWKLGFVNDKWDAGIQWNKLATLIEDKLLSFQLLMVNKPYPKDVGDFNRKKREEKASQLLEELWESIIGSVKKGKK